MAKKIKRNYDDGGDVDLGDDLSPIDTTATYMTGDNSGAPTNEEIANTTSGINDIQTNPQGALGNSVSANYNSDDAKALGISGGTAANSALSAALKALGLGGGNSSNTALLGALTGLLSAAGTAKNNKAKGTLPTLPVLPGSTSAPGYGPQGGYNFANYKGASAATPGVGYAPTTPTAAQPAASYYTYGQGPQQQQFQQVTGGAPITPLTQQAKGGHIKMATGGHVSKFDMGGPATMMPNPVARPPMPNGGALSQPMMGAPTPPMVSSGNMGMPPMARPMPAPPQMQRPVPTPQMPMQRPQAPVPTPTQPRPPMPAQSIMAQRMAAARPQMGRPAFADGGIINAMTPNTASVPTPQMVQSQGITQGGNSLQKLLPGFRRGPAATSHTVGLADGGALQAATTPPVEGTSRHVTGPGDGTSDSIPARLANGEYVIDAQAVSMLGNGDNSAGAKRLDEFRRNLRQHKGQALAKGKMAPDAKPVHKYMGGK